MERPRIFGLRAWILGFGLAFAVCVSEQASAAHAAAIGRPGGFGFRGGAAHFYGGYRGFYGWRGGYYGPGWGWGWPGYGLFLATLPFYYSTLWWNGTPYYYTGNGYYVWNQGLGEYQSVPPPPHGSVAGTTTDPQPGRSELFAYPRNGQDAAQQARDREDCRNWAASQTRAGTAQTLPANDDSLRAQTACLEGRGYSVR
jgi:hypothetical protein